MNDFKGIMQTLKYAGWLGHRWVILERSDHWTAKDGWRICAECSCEEEARKMLGEGQSLWHKENHKWNLRGGTTQ